MSTPPSHSSSALDIKVARLDVAPAGIPAFSAILSKDEQRRADRFAFERDRCRFTVARATLRRLLAQRLGVQPESVELTYGPHGKPALAPACAANDLRFNVSHSEDVAVYAFAHGREVGIDVEAIRTIDNADGIAARFFSRRENATYRALDPQDRPLGFFNCWTRKEAFVKALGAGLSHPLDCFDVSLAPRDPVRILRVDGIAGPDCGWTVHKFTPRPGFIGAVVTQNFNQ
jgi:4'-phosphopantetheinyl transferase